MIKRNNIFLAYAFPFFAGNLHAVAQKAAATLGCHSDTVTVML